MQSYYDGFCFDGQTFVYNPYSTLLFFTQKKFRNNWFSSGASSRLPSYLKTIHLTVDQFIGNAITIDQLSSPSVSRKKIDPKVYLYQLGYLSLRPGDKKDIFTLDYPNTEVKLSMIRMLMENSFDDEDRIEKLYSDLQDAAEKRDPVMLVKTFNRMLNAIPYGYRAKKSKPKYKTPIEVDVPLIEIKKKIKKHDEAYYRDLLIALAFGAQLNPLAEVHTSMGRSDLILNSPNVTWVIEVKVKHLEDSNKEETLALKALEQIIDKEYAASLHDPVILGLVANDVIRRITAWECRGGTSERTDPETMLAAKHKVERKLKAIAKRIAAAKHKASTEPVPVQKEEED
jgi:hypothetical protein